MSKFIAPDIERELEQCKLDRDRYQSIASSLAEEVERLNADAKAKEKAYQGLLHIGGGMANVMFNLKQLEGQAEAEQLDYLQLAWDYTRRQLNLALTEDQPQ